MDRNGPEWTGMDRNRPEWTGIDWNRLEWTGMDWNGHNKTKPGRTGPQPIQPEYGKTGPGRTEPNADRNHPEGSNRKNPGRMSIDIRPGKDQGSVRSDLRRGPHRSDRQPG